jgi:hypothetical protein
MATLLGTTNGVFGIAAQQTGFILDGSSQAYEQDEKTVKNITGDDTGISFYNERITFTLSGFIPATSPFTGTLAEAITLATAPVDHLKANVTGGLYVTKGITRTQASEEYQRIELNGAYHPLIIPS